MSETRYGTLVDKIVKNSSRVTKLDDLELLGVSCAVAQKVLEVLDRVAPVGSVGLVPCSL